MKKALICYFFGFSFIFSQDFSLQEAWRYVLDHNDGIKAEELGVQRQSKLSLSAKLSFLPNIDITAFYAHLANPIQLSTEGTKKDIINSLPNLGGGESILPIINSALGHIPNQVDLIKQDIIVGSINIIYPLYTGGQRYYLTKIAKIEEKDSQEVLRLKKLATFEELVKVYYSIWLQRELRRTLESIHQSALAHYHNALKLQKAGQIAKLEVLGAQVALQKTENKLKESQNLLEISHMALDIVLQSKNANPTSGIKVPKGDFLESEDYYVQKTIDSYPVLRSLDSKIQVAKEMKKIQIAKFLPTITAMGSYFIDNQFLLNHQSLPSWYVGVFARLPLITPGGRIPQIQAATITQMQLDKTKAQATKDMELLARRTYKEVLFAKQEYMGMDVSVKLAQENLKLQEKAFSQGLVTSLQVNDAINALSSVLIEQKTLAYKYIVLLSKLMVLSGDIDRFYEIQNLQ